ELTFVAEINGELAGHIIYSKSKIVSALGEVFEMLTFGPLAVLPKFQNLGIGKKLMLHSFDEARRMGFRAVIIFGHSDYYPRVGFRRASEFGITTSDNQSFDALMAYPLCENALGGISGRYYIDPVYESLNQKDAFEFDKRFPKKELYTPQSISVLLNRLHSYDAKKTIAGLNLPSLTMIITKSQRELSALPGIDKQTIETIRTVTRENNLTWGE
ncbi:MAG: N-acetyltransferase, partial [Clostridiales bacterium]|nr:N-acetyltransferase [Clostridiales bacterium]